MTLDGGEAEGATHTRDPAAASRNLLDARRSLTGSTASAKQRIEGGAAYMHGPLTADRTYKVLVRVICRLSCPVAGSVALAVPTHIQYIHRACTRVRVRVRVTNPTN